MSGHKVQDLHNCGSLFCILFYFKLTWHKILIFNLDAKATRMFFFVYHSMVIPINHSLKIFLQSNSHVTSLENEVTSILCFPCTILVIFSKYGQQFVMYVVCYQLVKKIYTFFMLSFYQLGSIIKYLKINCCIYNRVKNYWVNDNCWTLLFSICETHCHRKFQIMRESSILKYSWLS